MMLLIALAITVAFTASLATSLGVGNLDLDFWWELALLVVIMLLGHWLEMKAVGQAQGALDALAELLPDVAERITGSAEVETVPLAELRRGDVVLVRSGARVPAPRRLAGSRAGRLQPSRARGRRGQREHRALARPRRRLRP